MLLFCLYFPLRETFIFLCRGGSADEVSGQAPPVVAANGTQPAVIQAHDSLIGDLLSMDINPTAPAPAAAAAPPSIQPAAPSGNLDLLGGGLDSLVSSASVP